MRLNKMNFEFKYDEKDFCSMDEGIQYVFTMFACIYGSKFANHWGNNVDINSIMEIWKNMIGSYLTYKPSLNWAIKNLEPNSFVPTPMMFFDLCKQAGRIPVKPERTITHQPTQAEIEKNAKAREEAIAKIRQWKAGVKL